MTKQEKLKIENDNLKNIIRSTFWMARRYAHGRHTYAPGMVRRAYKTLKVFYPEINIRTDVTIKPPTPNEMQTIASRDDFLDDINSDIN